MCYCGAPVNRWWIDDYNRELDKKHREERAEKVRLERLEREAERYEREAEVWLRKKTEEERLAKIYIHNHNVLKERKK